MSRTPTPEQARDVLERGLAYSGVAFVTVAIFAGAPWWFGVIGAGLLATSAVIEAGGPQA